MANINRNELLLKIAGEEILLRPTFENIAAMESSMAGLAYLNWKFAKGLPRKAEGESLLDAARRFNPKDMPTFTEVAQVIYYNQAATKVDDPTKKMLSLEEVWALVLKEGMGVIPQVALYLVRLTAGDKLAAQAQDLTEDQKKN